MNCLEERDILCPYCGEIISVVVDCTEDQQSYVEDCSVCCQPMLLTIDIDTELRLSVSRENE